MLLFSICLLTSHVFAGPIPSSSTDLNLDVSSIPIDQESLANVGCTADTLSSEIASENLENDSDIFQRQLKVCPVQGIKLPWSKPKWRAPATLPALDPANVPRGVGRSSEFCLNSFIQTLVSCGGPEVWYEGTIGFVLNCVIGMSGFRSFSDRLIFDYSLF